MAASCEIYTCSSNHAISVNSRMNLIPHGDKEGCISDIMTKRDLTSSRISYVNCSTVALAGGDGSAAASRERAGAPARGSCRGGGRLPAVRPWPEVGVIWYTDHHYLLMTVHVSQHLKLRTSYHPPAGQYFCPALFGELPSLDGMCAQRLVKVWTIPGRRWARSRRYST